MMKRIWWHSIKERIKPILRRIVYLFPVQKNKLVFLNYDGKGYGDNPKYIAEELLRRNLACKLVWLVDGDVFVPGKIKKVERFGFEAYYELSTAKIIISNCKNTIPSYFKKKKCQFYLQTWHGDFALKFIEKEIEGILSASYLTSTKADSAMIDAVISGSQFFSKILKESFWLPENCSILEYGVPRNDIYFRGCVFKDELKRVLGFSRNEKILLYAPTFRDKGETDCYNLDFESLRLAFCQKTKAEWKIVVRLHPNITRKADRFAYGENIINGSVYSDQQELCMISDCLVTDYSSIMGDFLLQRKPVFLYVPDLDDYSSRVNGRGLRDMFFELPLLFNRTQVALENYRREVDSFMKGYYSPFDDGHASERTVNLLNEIMHF